ncbi:MAG: GNAT family N-acetyltransferase [Candidatus Magasanikbacteria bacterium]|jgi:predicted alpha/beta hydrolase family esterase
MTNIFIFHGVGGYPEENWFPWLKKELENSGNRVFVPQFPTPENQTLESWLKVLEQYKTYLDKDSILIGHSLGVPFALNVIEKYPVSAAFFVAGFVGKADNEFDEEMKTFAQREFDWEKIKNNCNNLYIYHSDNDPYLPIEKSERIAKNLDVEIRVVEGAGHFNKSAGYTTFNVLLEDIKKVLSPIDTTGVVLETERLKLVPISMKHLEDIFKEFTSEITTHMFPQPSGNIEDTKKFITDSLNRMKKGENLQLVAEDKNTGEFLGCMGFHEIHRHDPEMGVWLKKSAHGKGYGKEAMKAIKDWADKNISYEYIKYPVVKVNTPSRQIAEFLGGKIAREFIGTNQNGNKMEEVEYRIVKS